MALGGTAQGNAAARTGGSYVPSMPAGLAAAVAAQPAGHVVVLACMFTFDSNTVTTLTNAGWTDQGFVQSTGPDRQRIWLMTRIADGTEGATQSFTANADTPTSWQVGYWTGRSSATFNIGNNGSDSSSLTSPISASQPSGTAAAGDDVAFWLSIDQTAAAARWSHAVSSPSMTQQPISERNWSNLSLFTADNVNAGAYGSISFTATRTTGTGNGGWLAGVISLPAAPKVDLSLATGTGSAPAPSVQSVQPVSIGLASATAAAPAPSVQAVQPVSLGLASASAQAPAPVVGNGGVGLSLASATATAPAPTVQSVQPVSLGLAAAAAQAFAVVATNVVTLGLAAALASALALKVGNDVVTRVRAGLWNSRRGRGRR